ncbi:hypothetical protein [Longimicrobium sp.]|uniref:hypothetical protein n=1 Tax=Longimicrobium sp. TaxID=2029185 RepID=UPI002E335965|nr:hypothetical protein [Longimicrobium sp.]HEX6042510.1 hypothetical protein [Longimicrobium sp.]
MIDPEHARAVLREYHATASDQQIIDDLRRFSPELARRLGVDQDAPRPRIVPRRRGIAGALASFRHSVLRLFS